MRLLARFLRRDDQLSDRWIKAHARQAQRVEFQGVSIKFPIRKQLDSSPIWNRAKLKRVS